MGQYEILAAGFPNNAWVAFVLGDVLANGGPQMTENACRACEVQARKIWVVKDHFPGSRTIARHHVYDAIRKARCFEYLHDDLRAVDLGVGRLPDNDIAHQSGGGTQVGSDCRKVERGNRKNKTFQTAVFHPVPNAVLTIRLNILNFLEEIGIKAEEINQFTGRVNFRLEDVLGLRQHGGRIDFSAVWSCN